MSSYSLEAESQVCVGKLHFLEAGPVFSGVHTHASREKRKAGEVIPGFLKFFVPEGAKPASVMTSTLINSSMIRNLSKKYININKCPTKGTLIFVKKLTTQGELCFWSDEGII